MILLAALLLVAPEAPDCSAAPPPAAPWVEWKQSGAISAAAKAEGAPALTLGQSVVATLVPSAQVTFPATPGKGATDGHGGLLSLSLDAPARVGLALSGGAWIDVVDGATALVSVEHGHGPQCSGIRKIVWFDLAAGNHIVQIAGASTETITVMAAKAADAASEPHQH
jgi:hypothetical protein